jgi:hypothetical protein
VRKTHSTTTSSFDSPLFLPNLVVFLKEEEKKEKLSEFLFDSCGGKTKFQPF